MIYTVLHILYITYIVHHHHFIDTLYRTNVPHGEPQQVEGVPCGRAGATRGPLGAASVSVVVTSMEFER